MAQTFKSKCEDLGYTCRAIDVASGMLLVRCMDGLGGDENQRV